MGIYIDQNYFKIKVPLNLIGWSQDLIAWSQVFNRVTYKKVYDRMSMSVIELSSVDFFTPHIDATHHNRWPLYTVIYQKNESALKSHQLQLGCHWLEFGILRGVLEGGIWQPGNVSGAVEVSWSLYTIHTHPHYDRWPFYTVIYKNF